MKSGCMKSGLIVLAVFGATSAPQSQPTPPTTTPSNTYDSGNGGRYRLVVTSSSNGDKQYVIDTETGRVWHSTVDQRKQMIVFISFPYQNISGDLSTIPNETATGVVVSSSKTNSTVQPDDDPALADIAGVRAGAIINFLKLGDTNAAKRILDNTTNETLKRLLSTIMYKAVNNGTNE